MGLEDNLYHKRLRKFEAFDRIELAVVPRYKTSGLSGDEWRQSTVINFYFKGEVVHTECVNSMENAILLLGSFFVRQQEPIPLRVIKIEESGKCDQPSCAEQSVARFKLRRLTSDSGEMLDMNDQHLSYYRQFCQKHSGRGDCDREDCDSNYERISD
jgi:hypothetical protein